VDRKRGQRGRRSNRANGQTNRLVAKPWADMDTKGRRPDGAHAQVSAALKPVHGANIDARRMLRLPGRGRWADAGVPDHLKTPSATEDGSGSARAGIASDARAFQLAKES